MKHAHSITYHLCQDGHFHVELRDRNSKPFATFTLDEEQALDLADMIYELVGMELDIDTIGPVEGHA